MADRSPNFPQISLAEAIDNIRLVYQKEGRSKMPRLSALKPLGYTSINGRSLGILAALRAYGLIDGRGDDVRVSEDAITILNAPLDNPDRSEALVRAFEGPSAFALLRAKGEASPDTLRWHLIKSNFRDDAADKLLKVYLDSKELVNAQAAAYNFAHSEEVADGPKQGFNPSLNDMMNQVMPFSGWTKPKVEPSAQEVAEHTGLAMGVHERVLQSGMLSKHASYRVIVSGPVGEAEIDRLLKKLEMDKEILADAAAEPSTWAEEDIVG
ncbi:hypothetical protein [Sandarakinorhabdus sp. DWP1-3-1]|uniref:hypothetical protein n=1 Tax=Sandarakinorhabdus sp. DWP1-3-1 TaxID=2804627 RepID=UPI003CEBE906